MKSKRQNRNLTETAYQYVLERLSNGEIKPGQKLSEPSLSAACGVSRTPMREAIRRLIEEGVVYQIAKSGTYVNDFSAREVTDAYEIRSALETVLLARAIERLTAHDFTELTRHCERMHKSIRAMRRKEMPIMTGQCEADFIAADLAFHSHLLQVSGNSLALKIITNTYRRNQFFGTHSHQRTLKHVAIAWRYHCEILKACKKRNAQEAVFWMKAHIARSEKDILIPLSQCLLDSV